ERSDADLRLQRTSRVAAGAPEVHEGIQMGAGVGVEALVRQDLGDLRQRVLVIRLQLEDFLEHGAGLGRGALFTEVVRNLDELFDRFVGLARARVQISKRILRVPVAGSVFNDAQVLRDASIE